MKLVETPLVIPWECVECHEQIPVGVVARWSGLRRSTIPTYTLSGDSNITEIVTQHYRDKHGYSG